MSLYVVLATIIYSAMIFGVSGGIGAFFISPLQYLKVVRQETNMKYCSIAQNSYRNYGIAVFFRGAIPYTLLNFISSFAFGISDYLSSSFLLHLAINLSIENIFISIVIRAIFGGLVETFTTIYFETKEIAFNKGDLMSHPAKIMQIFGFVLLRNVIFWVGSALSFELSLRLKISYCFSGIIAFIIGIIVGIISTPFDVLATLACGSSEDKNFCERSIDFFIYSKFSNIFSGCSIRLFEVAFYTMISSLAMLMIY
jgi:hypothetical protein